MYKTTFL